MDFSTINVPLFLVVIGLILFQFFFMRRRKPEETQQDIVRNLLTDVRMNLGLVEVFRAQQQVKKFELVSWQMNKTKLDFLAQPLQVALSDAFVMAEDFSRQISMAKKHKSASYMVNINVDKLQEPLTKSKQGLEDWLLAKMGTKEPAPKIPGIFDVWFGKK